ncbi:hypothetical protein [Streptosporangium subroseum]|uniref:hypothetical protein n=1 Tax=Streptosporangium subroseum TaxID=106412 RepID=UPI00308E758F|nr:hypothetical protein OHB15_44160 [Streptosporangium subroseum]
MPPKAAISYLGPMPSQGLDLHDRHSFIPCFRVEIAGEQVFRVHTELSGQGSDLAITRLEVTGVAPLTPDQAHDALNNALLLYTVRRLEPLVAEWASTGTGPPQSGDVWILKSEDVPQLLALAREKSCHYQIRLKRDLFCTAASDNDTTLTSIIINNRRTAPTSKPLCQGCNLPNTDYICSHLMHPRVSGKNTLGGIMDRRAMTAMCDQGHTDRINAIGKCYAGGHDCWQRLIEVEEPAITPVSPLELAEAFDVLDAAWRLAFDQKKKPLLALSTVATPAALSLPCATRAEFETRISDLADLIDRIKIDEKLLRPRSKEELERDEDLLKGSLNRMDDCLHYKLPAQQHPAIDRAIRTLRTIRQARNAEQHGITEGGGLTAKLRDLGIHDAPPNWGGAWDVVRARAVEALTAFRHELMAYVNAP